MNSSFKRVVRSLGGLARQIIAAANSSESGVVKIRATVITRELKEIQTNLVVKDLFTGVPGVDFNLDSFMSEALRESLGGNVLLVPVTAEGKSVPQFFIVMSTKAMSAVEPVTLGAAAPKKTIQEKKDTDSAAPVKKRRRSTIKEGISVKSDSDKKVTASESPKKAATKTTHKDSVKTEGKAETVSSGALPKTKSVTRRTRPITAAKPKRKAATIQQ